MLTEGGGGVQEPLILADVICEQPLTRIIYFEKEGYNVHICAMLVVVILSGTYGGQTKDLTIELVDGEDVDLQISLARFNMKNNTV